MPNVFYRIVGIDVYCLSQFLGFAFRTALFTRKFPVAVAGMFVLSERHALFSY